MSISKVQLVVVGTLSDWRMQVWAKVASGSEPIFTRWKKTTDPGSDWTDWQPFPSLFTDGSTIEPLATALYATRQSQLFGMTGNGDLVWTLKASDDSLSDWSAWMPFLPPHPGITLGVGFLAAGILGTQLGPYFTDTPIMMWMAANDSPTVNSIQSTAAEFRTNDPLSYYKDWQLFQPQFAGQLKGIWPLYCGFDIPFAQEHFPVWGVANDQLYWCRATMAYDASGHILSTGPTWSDWQLFAQLPNLAVDSFAAALLPDGRIQLFASDTSGTLYSIWQDDVAAGTWLPAWTPFPQPGGRHLLVSSVANNVLFPNGPTQSMSLAVGTLPDQRLQLFAVDDTASIWTTWKLTTDPSSSWAPWVPF
jgi:hypothetical protein